MLTNCKPLLVLAMAALLTACKTNPAPGLADHALILPVFPAADFGKRPPLPTLSEVQTLTPEQQQDFLAYFNDPINKDVSPQLRVYDYLFEHTLSLKYDNETYTAAQTLELNRGNCLSLAILTTALARLADVDIEYRWVDTNPVYAMENHVVERVAHVKTELSHRRPVSESADKLNAKVKQYIIVVDFFPTQRGRYISGISAQQFNALYFLNIAGAALGEGDNAKAYWYAQEALRYDPLNASGHNMMAVIYRRVGMLAKAEEIYLFGIEHADESLSLLKNYRRLLTSQSRTTEAEAIDARLRGMEDPSPYHWFALAKESQTAGDYQEAIRYYNKALEMAPYLHEAYLGKAQSLYQLGSRNGAQEALRDAILNVDRLSTRSLYEAKLTALTRD